MSEPDDELLDKIYDLAKKQDAKDDHEPHVVELLSRYLVMRPDHAYAWYLYGDSLRVIGRFDEALVVLKKSLDLVPEHYKSAVYARIGMLCSDHHSPAEAKEWFRLATETGSYDEPWNWIFRGTNLACLGEFQQACECYQVVLQYDNVDKDEAYLNMGYALRAMGKYSEAIFAFQKALEIAPNYSEAQAALNGLQGIQETQDLAAQMEL